MKKQLVITREQLQAAVPPIPEAFRADMEQMIDTLPQRRRRAAAPRKEIFVFKKATVGFVLTVVLCMLSVGALAAAILGVIDMVNGDIAPMAQENDADNVVNESFSNEELAKIVALAKENGVVLDEDQRIMRALQNGEGYYEEETIMALCKAEFGPLPHRWTLEQYHWFGEVMVQIGFSNVNTHLVPGEGDLTLEQAREKAIGYITEETGKEYDLMNEEIYARSQMFYRELIEPGDGTQNVALGDKVWEIGFETDDIWLPSFSVTMNEKGECTNVRAYGGVDKDHYSASSLRSVMGPETQEEWHEFGELAKQAQVVENDKDRLFMAVSYPIPGEDCLTRDQAMEAAVKAADGVEAEAREAIYVSDGASEAWKVLVYVSYPEEEQGCWPNAWISPNRTDHTFALAVSMELDPHTGEVLHSYVRTSEGNDWLLMYATKRAYEEIFGELPEHVKGPMPEKNAEDAITTVQQLLSSYRQKYNHYQQWDMATYHRFGEEARKLTDDSELARCVQATEWPEEVQEGDISREEAIAAAMAFYGQRISLDDVLGTYYIAGEPHNIWKVWVIPSYPSILYEVDAKTGEVLSSDLYVTNEGWPDWYVFTRKSVYAPDAPAFYTPMGENKVTSVDQAWELGEAALEQYYGLGEKIGDVNAYVNGFCDYAGAWDATKEELRRYNMVFEPQQPDLGTARVTINSLIGEVEDVFVEPVFTQQHLEALKEIGGAEVYARATELAADENSFVLTAEEGTELLTAAFGPWETWTQEQWTKADLIYDGGAYFNADSSMMTRIFARMDYPAEASVPVTRAAAEASAIAAANLDTPTVQSCVLMRFGIREVWKVTLTTPTETILCEVNAQTSECDDLHTQTPDDPTYLPYIVNVLWTLQPEGETTGYGNG